MNEAEQFLTHREDMAMRTGVQEFEEWMHNEGDALLKPLGREELPAPERQSDSTVGTVMRSIGETPKQILGGVDDAGRNALGFLDPLTNWLNENVADLTYDPVGAPKTAAGGATRSVSQFLTGFIPILKGFKAAGVTNKVAAPMLAGAAADFSVFDPQQERLSNLWREAELPQNILTDYLASDPSDSAMEGRFKNALEGSVLGGAAEGIMAGARVLRGARQVKSADLAETAHLKARYGELSEKSFSTLGDISKPLIQTKVQKGRAAATPEQIAGRTVIDAGGEEVYINFARIDAEDDVKELIGNLANKYKGSIKAAQRGRISQRETVKLAEDLGMSVDDLLSRRNGQGFNAEEAVAARGLWAASAEKLLEAAKKAADPNAGPVDQFNFRKMMATHHAIQAEVIGARTETARALAAWRIPVGGSIEKARGLEQMIESMGGTFASVEMAKRLAFYAENGGDPAGLARIVEKGWGATSFDAFREVWINGLLSSPTTHMVNMSSNLAVALSQIYERGAASLISKMRGTSDVAPGEALAMGYGLVSGIKDAFMLAGKALKTGETGRALNKVDLPYSRSISSEAFRISSETGLGRAVDFIGEVARVPSRFLGAEDEFFKTIGYRMELHAQAARAVNEEGLKGAAAAKRMREIILNPPENIRIASADASLYNTFTNKPGVIGEQFIRAREAIPLTTIVLPFVRTPVNIARYAFERTPFAPLVGQWRDDIAAGGARADLALARMATGSTIMAMALDWADSGIITGMGTPNKGEREAAMRQGWQQYSVKVGDRFYSYNRSDPFGMTMGLAADIAEAVIRREIDEDDVDELNEVVAMATTAVAQVTINKTYLQGLSDFVNVMADPKRYSEGYVNNLVSSFVPGTALLGAVERVVDPTVREASTPYEAVRAKIAGFSESLPPRLDLWGTEIRRESGLGKAYDFFSPVQSRGIEPTPVDTELMRLADAVPGSYDALPQRIKKKTSFDGVPVNFKEWPKVYEEYVKLAGNELKHPAWNLGLKDYLNEVISGKHPMSAVYEMRPDELKLSFIRDEVEKFRKLAQREIMNNPEFEGFALQVRQLKQDRLNRRMPQ